MISSITHFARPTKKLRRYIKPIERKNDSFGDCLDLLHMNMVGSMNVKTNNREEYFITFVDECPKFSCVYLLQSTLQILERFKKFKKAAEKIIGTDIIIVKFDR